MVCLKTEPLCIEVLPVLCRRHPTAPQNCLLQPWLHFHTIPNFIFPRASIPPTHLPLSFCLLRTPSAIPCPCFHWRLFARSMKQILLESILLFIEASSLWRIASCSTIATFFYGITTEIRKNAWGLQPRFNSSHYNHQLWAFLHGFQWSNLRVWSS